jgi:hypothetical protein
VDQGGFLPQSLKEQVSNSIPSVMASSHLLVEQSAVFAELLRDEDQQRKLALLCRRLAEYGIGDGKGGTEKGTPHSTLFTAYCYYFLEVSTIAIKGSEALPSHFFIHDPIPPDILIRLPDHPLEALRLVIYQEMLGLHLSPKCNGTLVKTTDRLYEEDRSMARSPPYYFNTATQSYAIRAAYMKRVQQGRRVNEFHPLQRFLFTSNPTLELLREQLLVRGFYVDSFWRAMVAHTAVSGGIGGVGQECAQCKKVGCLRWNAHFEPGAYRNGILVDDTIVVDRRNWNKIVCSNLQSCYEIKKAQTAKSQQQKFAKE